jgi:hypothetical protein
MRNVNVFFSAVTATIRGKVFFGNLFQEWEPKLRDLDWLKNSHYQWQYGQSMNREEEAIQFLSFSIQKVKETGGV